MQAVLKSLALNCVAMLTVANLALGSQRHHVYYGLTVQQRNLLQHWLSNHPSLRLATDADCHCADDIEQMRKGYNGTVAPVRDYHPYQVSADFNGDGRDDFAVVVVEDRKEDSFTLLVFNGPLAGTAAPSFLKSLRGMTGGDCFSTRAGTLDWSSEALNPRACCLNHAASPTYWTGGSERSAFLFCRCGQNAALTRRLRSEVEQGLPVGCLHVAV